MCAVYRSACELMPADLSGDLNLDCLRIDLAFSQRHDVPSGAQAITVSPLGDHVVGRFATEAHVQGSQFGPSTTAQLPFADFVLRRDPKSAQQHAGTDLGHGARFGMPLHH